MKRLGTIEIVLPNVKLRVPAILKSILGLGFIILTYICIGGIHANNYDKKDAYIASIFGPDFAADRVIQPDAAMHTLRNCNTDTFSDSIDNLSAWCQTGKATKFTKNIRFTVKKIIVEDASQSNIDTCHYIDISLIWNLVTREQGNNSSHENGTIDLYHKISSQFKGQLLWNPDAYSDNILRDNKYETGTLFAVLHKHFVPTIIADNTFDGKAQTEINYTKLEDSPSELKVYGQSRKIWKGNFIMREVK
jgi:hypothetical protein